MEGREPLAVRLIIIPPEVVEQTIAQTVMIICKSPGENDS